MPTVSERINFFTQKQDISLRVLTYDEKRKLSQLIFEEYIKIKAPNEVINFEKIVTKRGATIRIPSFPKSFVPIMDICISSFYKPIIQALEDYKKDLENNLQNRINSL